MAVITISRVFVTLFAVIAAVLVGNAELWWSICDANIVVHPAELADIGRHVRITLPAGIPGPGSLG